MIKTIQILAISFFSSAICFAQNKNEFFFEKGAKICFVGNSITHGGEFYHNILLYHVTRFPEQPVSFYNYGISGDVTTGLLNRMEDALRRIKFIEYNPYFKESPFKDNLSLLETHLDSVFTVKYRSPYYNNELKEYISDKPRQDEYRMASDDIRQKVYKLARPEDHSYRITAQ